MGLLKVNVTVKEMYQIVMRTVLEVLIWMSVMCVLAEIRKRLHVNKVVQVHGVEILFMMNVVNVLMVHVMEVTMMEAVALLMMIVLVYVVVMDLLVHVRENLMRVAYVMVLVLMQMDVAVRL
jgi:hypothetical protein